MLIPNKKFKKGKYQGLKDLSDLVDGEEYFCLGAHGSGRSLQFGTIYLCTNCQKPATVNTVWVAGSSISEEMTNEGELLGVLPELGRDDQFEDCDVCDVCSSKKDSEEAA